VADVRGDDDEQGEGEQRDPPGGREQHGRDVDAAPAKVSAQSSRTIAVAKSASPMPSSRRRLAARDSPMRELLGHSRISASTPTTRYGSRHRAAPATADSSAPREIPRPTLVPHTAVAWVWRGASGKSLARIASPHASTAAPPNPSTTRAAMNTADPVAAKQPSAPVASAAKPVR
jgi:hypothetical protein